MLLVREDMLRVREHMLRVGEDTLLVQAHTLLVQEHTLLVQEHTLDTLLVQDGGHLVIEDRHPVAHRLVLPVGRLVLRRLVLPVGRRELVPVLDSLLGGLKDKLVPGPEDKLVLGLGHKLVEELGDRLVPGLQLMGEYEMSKSKAVFFDDYSDFKKRSEDVEKNDGEFVCSLELNLRRIDSSDASDLDTENAEIENACPDINQGADSDLDFDCDAPENQSEREARDDDDWKEATDPASGLMYYWNSNTGEAAWTRPIAREKPKDLHLQQRHADAPATSEVVTQGSASTAPEASIQSDPRDTAGCSESVVSTEGTDEQGDHCILATNGGEQANSSHQSSSEIASIEAEVPYGAGVKMTEPTSAAQSALIQKTAKFIAEKGAAAEATLVNGPKAKTFAFLQEDHPLHAFYKYQVDLESISLL
eukprot:gene1780-2446_t